MDINQIRCLLALLDSGNYCEAADKLHISQSSVSKRIIAFEKELGIRLVEKKGRQYTVSESGKKVIKDLVEIARLYDQISDTIAEHKQQASGVRQSLRIIGIPSMARYNIVALISAFAVQCPEIEVTIDEMEADLVFPLLQRAVFDVAYCSDIGLDKNEYTTQHILKERFMLAVPHSNPLCEKEQVSLSDLKDENFIFITNRSLLYEICVEGCEKAGFQPKVFSTTARPDIAFQYIHQNIDCVYMGFRRTLLTVPAQSHKVLPITDSPAFSFVFAWKKDVNPSPALSSFLQFAKTFDLDPEGINDPGD